ncbi:DUF58 domain-containing protein [Noviherbaspirillum galbum]|uniref:DUF58 domain-containing protein n=1 Tax=Noviherbaspirillum galbum TaxID=2709383 RepID=A0A6B3SVV5_9BURK|nr:DUF58 domain-containing protein [Noviherbaspirillum galbum]NEX63525.1 DUF58 domain-containing protein [Noviherbaspirillum galbum]
MSASTPTPEALLRRMEMTVLRRLDGLLHGDYHTLFRGIGIDLADLREYQYQDDVRHIDWNVTARMQTPYVKEFHEERELTAWFLLDLSGSEDFGSQQVSKRMQAIYLTAVLASVLNRHGNRFGAVLYGAGKDSVLTTRNGRQQILRLLHGMHGCKPPDPATSGSRAGTRLHQLLETAAGVARRRSLVFLISDFISEPGWERPLAALTHRHDVIAIRLYDPLEMSLPDLGLLTIQDAETAEQILVDTHDAGFRSRFVAAVGEREERLRESFAEAGVDVLEISTEDDIVDALYRFSDLRKHASRLATGGSAQPWRAS